MTKINRLLINISTDNLDDTKLFYTTLFDFKVTYDSDWFVHLRSDDKNLELGLIDRSHDLVPEAYRGIANGCYLTIVVDNVDTFFELAKAKNMSIIEDPAATFYGQRRMLLKDPNGVLIDVSSMM